MPDDLIFAIDTAAELREESPEVTALCRTDALVLGSANGEGRLRKLLETIPAPIYTTDAQGRITFYNQAAVDLAGRRPELGKDEWCVTWRLYQPDGTPLPHDLCPMAIALKENRAVRGVEAIAERPDGTRVPFMPLPTPLRDETGTLIGAVNVLVDISERTATEQALRASEERYRQLNELLEQRVAERTRELIEANQRLRAEATERERAEAALRQAQKMEAVGQLASGMAHDFNNLLTAILGNLELAEARLTDDNVRRLISAASRAALRGARLNEQMLAFSRKQHLAPRPVDLNELIGDMTELLQRTLGGTVEVRTALSPGLWPALADPTQIELVVLNLSINARDALPNGGTVRIATRNVKAGEGGKAAALGAGEYVCIAVSDNGVGMPVSVVARACEPFFTTKEPGKGSGLGLPQVYGVARQSGGDIVIHSTVGQGTTVEVYLPRSYSNAAPLGVRGKPNGTSTAGQTLTVLVVDDQPDVREVAVAHLEGMGYRVAQAPNGSVALGLIGDGGEVDLLIADYAMAEMNGVELARTARALCPALPVIIMTGYSEVGAIDVEIPGALLLKKPYRLADLTGAVEQVLLRGESGALPCNVVALHRP